MAIVRCRFDGARQRRYQLKNKNVEVDAVSGHPQAAREQGIDAVSIATPPTTGTRWPRSGRCRPARTSTSRSRSATTSAKAGGSSRPPASTTGSARPARRAAARTASPGGHRVRPRRQARQAASWPAACATSAARRIGQVDGPQDVPKDDRLRPVVRPGPDGAADRTRSCTTTGTGSGTTATATSATRASTRWTWPAGA